MNEEIKEEWRDIVGYEGLYQVSNTGRVKNIKKNFEVKQVNHNAGYKSVHLYLKGQKHLSLVHRLVALAFIPNPENKPYIDHIDGTRDNNCVSNLRWATASENALNPATFVNQLKKIRKTHCTKEFSEKISKVRSTPEFWKKYRKSYEKTWEANGKRDSYYNEKPIRNIETGQIWKSGAALAKFLNVKNNTVHRYCNGTCKCKKEITFENGIVIKNPHFEYVAKKENLNAI